MLDPQITFNWSSWSPLNGCWRGTTIPQLPGLYRIRRVGSPGLDYLGQTGAGSMTLRKRLAMLAGVFAPEMPYRDPHTAAPALWALRQESGCEYEVSIAPIAGTTPHRKGLEALAISLYRQENQRSPTVNFGRMPPGYQMSSGNNQRLATADRRFRGGVAEQLNSSHLPSMAPVGPLTDEVTALDWCGHIWSPWMQMVPSNLPLVNAIGIYRIRHVDTPTLLYIGQGRIAARLLAHVAKIALPAHPQGLIFADPQQLVISWVVNRTWYVHQLLELENDLIAAHVLFCHTPPAAQFLG